MVANGAPGELGPVIAGDQSNNIADIHNSNKKVQFRVKRGGGDGWGY